MKKQAKYIALICGTLSIAVTVLLYLLTFDNIFNVPMRWVSLLFLILAEIIGTIKGFCTKRTIFGVTNIVTSIVHIMVILIISLIFVNVFPLFIVKYILINILALCVLLVADIVLIFFASNVEKQNDKLKECQLTMMNCVEKAASFCVEFDDTEYKKDLEEIAELLKYCDNSCLTQDEVNIMNKLDELKKLLNNNNNEAAEKIIEIKNIIKLRSVKVSSSKRGGY